MEQDIASLLQPLQPEPCGEDPKAVDQCEQLGQEIGKLDAIDRVPVDWHSVIRLANEILSQHSKDIRSANHLAFALFQTEGFNGLTIGFSLLHQLIQCDYAEQLFPRRPKRQEKARAAPFLWLETKLEKHFEANNVESVDDLDGADNAIAEFKTLSATLRDFLGDEAPLFANLKRLFTSFEATLAEHKASQPSEPEPSAPESSASEIKNETQQDNAPSSAQTTPVATAPPAPKPTPQPLPTADSGSLTSPAEINKALNSAGNVLKNVSLQLRTAQTFSANAFYLSRTAKWVLIQELPASGFLPRQPSDQTLQQLAALESAKSYTELVELAEREFNNGAMFCIALHRYVYNGLMGLGQTACAEVVRSTTKTFATRFPALSDTAFSNGEPFLDELSKIWLDTADEGNTTNKNSASTVSSGTEQPWLDASREATALITSGDIEGAVLLFQKGMDKATGIQESLYWRFELASVLAKSGLDDLVLMNLSYIHKTLLETNAALWQRNFSIGVLRLMLDCHKRLQKKQKYDAALTEAVNALKHELVVLSPSDALSFTESKT